ncbi:ArsR family transcriptional regulator [Seongchinamella sediminis]|uniref:ArsR family transcriptional regulator n=2 Tax=Seongchinamella sediminis TaxID=2283635 RepID=A0A3L7DXW3_9GAMM|nr:ArsR family transcriptional regulator [Seongchinamella sediminis]
MQQNAGSAAELLKDLSHPGRLLVLCALVTREHTVGELEALTGLGQSALSQHLARLRDGGLVTTRREAQRIFYAISDGKAQIMLEALHRIYCADGAVTADSEQGE